MRKGRAIGWLGVAGLSRDEAREVMRWSARALAAAAAAPHGRRSQRCTTPDRLSIASLRRHWEYRDEMAVRSRFRAAARAFAVNFHSAPLRRAQLSFGAMWASEWGATVAVSVFAYRDGGAAAVALVAVVRMVPAAIVAPFAATLADRHRRERVLAGVGLVRAAALGAAAALLVMGAASAWVYASVAAATLAQALYRPAHSALLPGLCRTPHELTSANVVRGLLDSLATLVGPLAAAGLIALGGAEAALAACALASLASALLVTRLRYEQSRRARPLGGGVRQGIEGLRAIAADPELGLLTALGAVQTFLRGCSTVLMVVVAIELLGGGDADVGLLNAAIGAGAIAGSLLASTITWNGRLARCFGVGVVLWGAPLAVLAGLPTEAAALLVFAALGVGNALVDIGVFTLMARLSPDRVMARVFAAFEALITLAVALGAAITPAAIELLGEQGALLALGLIGPVAVAAAWPALRALDRRMVTRDADIDVLRQVAMLQPLPEPTIEHLASGLQREVFEPGTTVFDEGDPGASFYIITAGRAEVTKGPVSIARLGPGECFGEIALLRSDLPRTATIRAAGDAALHVGVIDQGRFVAAVTGFASSAELAEELVAVRLPEAASTQT